MKISLAVASASLVAWTGLAFARGAYWKARVDELRGGVLPLHPSPSVEIVVPARNEAETIGAAVRSLVTQRYAGPLHVTLVDDDSDDETSRIASDAVRALPHCDRFASIRGRALEAGWTGKLNALDAGVAHVRRERGEPAYWLFTDADIEHDANNVTELVAKAEGEARDLVSLMVRLRCESGWERLLVPAFVYFFAKLYPFAWSNDRRHATAAAAGGCVLLRADALDRIGGLQAIGDRLIDDCALAAAVKHSGGAIWLGLTTRTSSIREYGTLDSFWDMVKRSAFTQLDRSYAATAVAVLAMSFLYLAPPALVLVGTMRRDVRVTGVAGIAWILMASLYRPTSRAYARPWYESFALPFAAALYTAMTVDSAIAHARGRGGFWKGRSSAGSNGSPLR